MFRARKAREAVQAVRTFLEQETDLGEDIIEAIIVRGKVSRLAYFQLLTMEDLTHTDKSIISPHVIPEMEARYLLTVTIPQMLKTLSQGTEITPVEPWLAHALVLI